MFGSFSSVARLTQRSTCCFSAGYHHTSQQPPRIIEHPVDTTVARHDPATLNCHASGEPEPSITWYKDGATLRMAQDARSHRVVLPAGNLFFLRVAQSRKETDAGVYWCEAANALGKARSRNATLTVAGRSMPYYRYSQQTNTLIEYRKL
ncbi:hypothetical protein NQ318_003025 [Aromia moschata]|uniref:Ig-like domain-containing protein n=1 Tax=Aromia moschata TaxID=1265417 RepID=A0AAV8YSE5_9CUCU|nr:hypothetical protein NQ318_003025 [Aromia moschata]